MSQIRSLTIAILVVDGVITGAIAADTMPTTQELINAISTKESFLSFATAQYEFQNSAAGLLRQGSWWYSYDGRQKYDNTLTQVDPATNEESQVRSVVAFDGEKMRVFFQGQGDPFGTGRIAALEPSMFCNPFLPSTLFGYGFDAKKGTFLSGILRDARQVTVHAQMETLSGHTCYVVDVVGAAVNKESGEQYDMRVWLDPQRDMRPIQIDRYFGLAGHNQLHVLMSRMRIIDIMQVDGVWFPIEAKREWYFIKEINPPEGMTDAEAQALKERDINEWQSKMTFVTRPGAVETLRIQRDSLTVNKDIPQDKFTIHFPAGTRMYDQFLQMGYYAGGRTAKNPHFPELAEIEQAVPVNGVADPNTTPVRRSDGFTGSTNRDLNGSPKAEDPTALGSIHTGNTWIMGAGLIGATLAIGATVAFVYKRRKSKK